MLSVIDIANIYTAITFHFQGKYDAAKYHCVIKAVTPKNYTKRHDRIFIAKLKSLDLSREKLIDYFIANFVAGENHISKMNWYNYEKYCERRDNLKQIVSSEFFQLPKSLERINYETLSPETIVAINEVFPNRIKEDLREAINNGELTRYAILSKINSIQRYYGLFLDKGVLTNIIRLQYNKDS